uniref:Uncharacterized protein n=1 Tax=Strongyloides papillosus TaxID=174720 RepID=A0A0N5BPD5_STREA
MKFLVIVLIFTMYFIQSNGITISCNSSNQTVCHIDVGSNPYVERELYEMLPENIKTQVNDILNNTQYDNHRKRTELNYLLNKDVPHDILEKYGKLVSERISKQVNDNLRKSGIYDPCFPFCNRYGNKLSNLSDRIIKNVNENLRRSGIYDPCFPFCGSSDPMFRNYRRRRY